MNTAAILAGGFALVRNQPKAVAIWGLFYLVSMGLAFALVWPMFGDFIAFQQQAMTAQAANLPPPTPHFEIFGAIFGIDAVLLIAFIVIFAAAVRAVAVGGNDAFGFLRLGMDELRLLGLGILLFLIGFAVAILFIIVAVIVTAALVAALGQGAVVAGILLYLVGVGAMIWAEVRISLAGALTIFRGRIVLREAWRVTRGRFWTLFGVYFLIWLVFIAISIVAIAVSNPGMLSAYASGMQPQDMEAALAQQQAMMENFFGPKMIVTFAIGSVLNTVLIAFSFGAIATAAIGYDRDDHVSAAPAPPLDPAA